MIGVPSGVTLKFKYIRSSQSYIFPIHLSEEVIPAAVCMNKLLLIGTATTESLILSLQIFYATVTPMLVWFVIKRAVIDPMNAEERKKNIEKARDANRARMVERQKEAMSAISLMSATFDRILSDEEKKKGLIIVQAFYGKAGIVETVAEEGLEVIDVKVPIQCLVKDSRLVLHKASKV